MAVKSTINKWAAEQILFGQRVEEVIAGVIHTRSMMLAPKLSGALRENGRVVKGTNGRKVVYGDSSVPYARRRHFENRKNPQTLHYLQRAGDSVKKENIKKYVDMSR